MSQKKDFHTLSVGSDPARKQNRPQITNLPEKQRQKTKPNQAKTKKKQTQKTPNQNKTEKPKAKKALNLLNLRSMS